MHEYLDRTLQYYVPLHTSPCQLLSILTGMQCMENQSVNKPCFSGNVPCRLLLREEGAVLENGMSEKSKLQLEEKLGSFPPSRKNIFNIFYG